MSDKDAVPALPSGHRSREAGPPTANAVRSSTREVEWKLVSDEQIDVDAIRALLPEQIHLGAASSFSLTATYYDTDDLRLARRGITLRRRSGGSDDGWHLKLPNRSSEGSQLDRDEIAVPLTDNSEPPVELASLVSAFTRSKPLQRIGVLRTHRTVHALVLEDDVIGELCRDEVRADVALPGAPTSPTQVFHEWEVEARSEAVDEVSKMVDALVGHGFAVSTSPSKLRQALGGSALAADPLAHNEKPSRRRSARDDITYYLKEQVEVLLQQDHRIRLQLPDAIHRSRVAARRVRSALRTFSPLLDSESLAELRTDVVWAAGVLGSERDLDVIEIRLLTDLDDMSRGTISGTGSDRAAVDAVRALIERSLASRRDEAHKNIIESINSERWSLMLDQLVAVAHDPPTTSRSAKPAARVLPSLASKQWKSLAERAKHLSDADPAESWHHARISAKRARYAAEACAPAMGREPARFAKALAEVTELLGNLQDTAISRAMVHEIADGVVDPDLVFVLGRLHAHEEAAAEQLRRDFPHVWKAAARPRLRRWLKA